MFDRENRSGSGRRRHLSTANFLASFYGVFGACQPQRRYRGLKNGIVHMAGASHADEARIHRRVRDLKRLLNTINTLQNSVLTASPIAV